VWHGGTDLPPCHSAAGSWRRAAPPWRRNQAPAAMPRGGRDLTLWGAAAGACRRGVRHQMYLSQKFWFDHLFFENHDKLNIKNSFSYRWFWKCHLVQYNQQECLLGYPCFGCCRGQNVEFCPTLRIERRCSVWSFQPEPFWTTRYNNLSQLHSLAKLIFLHVQLIVSYNFFKNINKSR
jgi:hypothetical protein